MKIAIIGQNVDQKKKIVTKFLNLNNSYGSPKESIYDDVEKNPDTKYNQGWNQTERQIYDKMSFLISQMDKFADKKNIIYIGSSIDILAEVMALYSIEEVSEDFVEKMIYWNRKLMQKLDLIYWLPSPQKVIKQTDSEDGQSDQQEVDLQIFFNSQLEIIYNNIWNDYLQNFDNSEILPRDCPGIAFFESDNPALQLNDSVSDLDNVDQSSRMEDMAKLERLIRDKKMRDKMFQILSQNTIPLVDGGRMPVGEIKIT